MLTNNFVACWCSGLGPELLFSQVRVTAGQNLEETWVECRVNMLSLAVV